MIAYQLISDITVTSATTSVSFTGLNITKDDDYLLVSDFKNNTTSSTNDIYLTVNGNNTLTNYYYQRLYASSATITAVRDVSPVISKMFQVANGVTSTIICSIKLTNNGYYVAQGKTNLYNGTSYSSLLESYATSTFTASSLTSLTISAERASSIGIGSRFQLYKLTAQKIADIIVSSPTTSVDITGLAIDKGSEYMLVSNIDNMSGASPRYQLFANGNNVQSNYYNQYLFADISTVSALRENYSNLTWCSSGYKTLSVSNIKITNNGYFVFQSSNAWNYPNYIKIVNFYTTSTFTTDGISSLRIQSDATNAIGTNSRFQLYKLK